MESTEKTISLTAKILAEVLMGRVWFDSDRSEPEFVATMQTLLQQFKRIAGSTNDYDRLKEEWRPAAHSLADLLFDAVTGVQCEKTIEGLKKLSVPQRTVIENMAASMTGKGIGRSEGRWMDELWSFRKVVNQALRQSVSGITHQELRGGFDPLLHEVVDVFFNK